MKIWMLPVLALVVLLSGCVSPEQQRAADEERCRSYGFAKRNDAFAECLQRLDMARRARLYDRQYVERIDGPIVIVR